MDTTASLTTHVDTAKCVATTPIPSGILPTDGMPHQGRTEDTTDIEDCTLSELMHKHCIQCTCHTHPLQSYAEMTIYLSVQLLSKQMTHVRPVQKARNLNNGEAKMACNVMLKTLKKT